MLKSRKSFFVCSGNKDNLSYVDEFQVDSVKEAEKAFFNAFQIFPDKILGPFLKKKVEYEKIDKRTVVFSSKKVKAEYNGWLVNALYLKEPEDHAMLVFISKLDESNAKKPKLTIIPIEHIREIK